MALKGPLNTQPAIRAYMTDIRGFIGDEFDLYAFDACSPFK
ncbi:hypothetical protein ACIGW5_29620 [Streptomyces prasinus]